MSQLPNIILAELNQMKCKIYFGSVCILLEDLGFKMRKPDHRITKAMTYYHYQAHLVYEKIFADIDDVWVLEMCLVPDEMHIDRWEKNPRGLYMVDREITVNLYNPESISKTTDFVMETIEMSKTL